MATTTRSARIVPPAVWTSTHLRLNVIFFAGERSKNCAPAIDRGAARPKRRAIGIERRAVAGADRRQRADAGLAGDGSRVDQRRVEPGLAADLLLFLQPRELFGCGGDEQRAARLEVALEVEPADQRDEIERRAPPGLPAAAARRAGRAPSRPLEN